MKLYTLILFLISSINLTLAQQDLFLKAEDAYAKENYSEALNIYNKLIEQPLDLPELFFNRGNAYFKLGNLPLAIKSYRKAQFLAPLDPDIRVNLAYTLEAAGALMHEPNNMEILFTSLSEDDWIKIVILAYTIIVLSIFSVLIPKISNKFSKVLYPAILLLVLSFFALVTHNQRDVYPEFVIIENNTNIKLAPLPNSRVAFTLPAGSIVKSIKKHQNKWFQIKINDKTGWVKLNQIDPI